MTAPKRNKKTSVTHIASFREDPRQSQLSLTLLEKGPPFTLIRDDPFGVIAEALPSFPPSAYHATAFSVNPPPNAKPAAQFHLRSSPNIFAAHLCQPFPIARQSIPLGR